MTDQRGSLSHRKHPAGRNSSTEFEKKLDRSEMGCLTACRRMQSQSAPSSEKLNGDWENLMEQDTRKPGLQPRQSQHAPLNAQQGGEGGLMESRIHLLRMFGRIERLAEKIDEAFVGQPFFPDLPPEARANQRRFRVYFQQQRQVGRLMAEALELWAFACGVKREDDWVPSD